MASTMKKSRNSSVEKKKNEKSSILSLLPVLAIGGGILLGAQFYSGLDKIATRNKNNLNNNKTIEESDEEYYQTVIPPEEEEDYAQTIEDYEKNKFLTNENTRRNNTNNNYLQQQQKTTINVSELQIGDIILSGPIKKKHGNISTYIAMASGSEFSHIGIVYKKDDNAITYIYDMTLKGLSMHPVEDYIKKYEGLGYKLQVRKLINAEKYHYDIRYALSKQMIDQPKYHVLAVVDFYGRRKEFDIQSVKKYPEKYIIKPRKNEKTIGPHDHCAKHLTCASTIAEIFHNAGVIDFKGLNYRSWAPADFTYNLEYNYANFVDPNVYFSRLFNINV